MIDIHAHFAEEGYFFPEEWDKIRAAGVERVVLAGDTAAHSKMHRDFCAAHQGAYFCAGIHPSEAGGSSKERELAEIEELLSDGKCVAVGEIGLDYHYPDANKRAQRELFVAQLLLAERFSLPVQIHSRDSAADMLIILREMRAHLSRGFLLHCYSHGADMLPLFAELGAYFSFGGVVCFKNAKSAVKSAEVCPLDRLLTETDSPYLSPLRGQKNSPANIPLIAARLAEIKGVPLEEVNRAAAENAARLFRKLK